MFNGLIREIATLTSLKGDILTLQTSYKAQIGDSISVNGACLTVITKFDGGFCVQISPHTKQTLASNKLQQKAHIEPAMVLGDKLDGHFLQGHIDYIGVVSDIKQNDNCYDFYIKMPLKSLKFCVPQGSIGIDGVSLTISGVLGDIIKITVIKHTFDNTLFATYKVGEKLNCESDMFARYLQNIIKHQTTSKDTGTSTSTGTGTSTNDTSSWSYIDGQMARY